MEAAAADGWYGSHTRGNHRVGLGWRLLWWIILPPEGHRTAPTATGFVLIMVCLGIGAAAYNAGGSSNILFLALSILFSSILLSGVLSSMNFRGILWRLSPASHLRAEEPAEIGIEVLNTKKHLPSFSLILQVRAPLTAETSQLYLDRSLPPLQIRELTWEFVPSKRGHERLQVAALESSYPFGFLRKFVHSNAAREVMIWPARVAYEFRVPETRAARTVGANVRRPGAGEQLYNIRPYQPGDQQRMVHWKATARNQRLMVRQVMDERQQGFFMVVESSKARWANEEQFELMVSLAGSLAEDLFRDERLTGYTINNGTPQAVTRLADLHGFMETLAILEIFKGKPKPERLGDAPVITFTPQTTEGVHVLVNGREVGGTH